MTKKSLPIGLLRSLRAVLLAVLFGAGLAPGGSALPMGQEGDAPEGEGQENSRFSPIIDGDGEPDTDGYRAEQVIVRLAPDADVAAFNARHGTKLIDAIASRNVFLLGLPPSEDEADAADTFGDERDVVWAELNFANQAPEGRPRNFFVRGSTVEGSTEQYAADLLGLDTAQTCGRGVGIVVAVVDTGVDAQHAALSGVVLDNGRNLLEGSRDIADVGNGLDDDGDGTVDEMTGHGTHVAGIVAQVAPGASILPIKALDSDGVGDAFFLAAAIYYAIDHGADVINLSLGSTHDARVVTSAVAEATRAGIVVTAAAGNENRQMPAEYPAAGGSAVGVASTNATDLKSRFSNYHPALTISAPGSKIVSAFPGNDYVTWSGTSMATPFVSGAAALLLGQGMSAVAAVDRLAATAVDLDATNPDYAGLLGMGRLDAAAAMGCR